VTETIRADVFTACELNKYSRDLLQDPPQERMQRRFPSGDPGFGRQLSRRRLPNHLDVIGRSSVWEPAPEATSTVKPLVVEFWYFRAT
jgi:hypothetical protein